MNVEQFPRYEEGYFELYNGCWEGRVVLVKKINRYYFAEHFLREIVVATQMATHNNAHKILGCCLETDLPVLVYEWMPPETLHDRLFLDDENKSKAILEWKDRLRIAWEISHVVAYLNSAFPRPIILRNLRPSNVFLDQDNATKLGDFSRSLSIPEDKDGVEYKDGIGRKITKNTDVYSFGMLLFMLLTGKEHYSSYKIVDRINSAQIGIRNNCFHKIVDPTIIGNGVTSIEDYQLRACAQLVLRCVLEEDDYRPTMLEVATELKNMIRSLEGGGIYRYFLGSEENLIQNKALVREASIYLFHGKVDPIRYFSADELNNMNVEFWDNSCNWYQGSWEGRAVLVKLHESLIEGATSSKEIQLRLSREIVVATQMSTHNNVQKLLGCCLETKFPVLIYEWVAAETLEDRILLKDEKQNKLPVLEWKDRLRIAWEISCALSAFPRPIIRGDLKLRYVFLNQDNTAILSNFGPCIFDNNFKADANVHSFGVIFLMLLTGKEANKSTNIIGWVTESFRHKRIGEIVDPVINISKVPASEWSASINLALCCTSKLEYQRPTMEDVEYELGKMLYRLSKCRPVQRAGFGPDRTLLKRA